MAALAALASPRLRLLRWAEALGRRPAQAALGGAVAGLLVSAETQALAVLCGVLVIWTLAYLRLPALGLTAGTLLIAGAAVGDVRLAHLDGSWLAAHSGTRLEARAHIVEPPRPSRFGRSVVMEVASGEARGERLLARVPERLRLPARGGQGSEVLVTGAIRRPVSRPGASFDFPAHLRRRGVAAELAVKRLRFTGGRRGGLMGRIDAMRGRAERSLSLGLSPERAALLRGMVLGQDEAITRIVRDDFRRSGLGHLLAVSGQNVMLLGLLALPVLSLMGLGVRGRIAALLLLIAVYVPLAGAGPSLQRAGVMGAAGLVALLAGRPASRLYALLLAAAVTLLHNPRVAGEPGWQLSFAAVAGILSLGPPLRRALGSLPRPLAEGVTMTVAATLATAPLVAHHFEAVSLTGLPANVLALPVVAPIMWAGMVQIALGQLLEAAGPVGLLATAAAELLGRAATLLLAYLEWLARFFAEAPGAAVELPLSSAARVAAAYAALAALWLGFRRAGRRLEPARASGAAFWRRLPVRARVAIAGAALGAGIVASAVLHAPPRVPDHLTVSFLDVGQGDATLIQHPDGSAVLFDGGRAEARVARLLPAAGVRRLSAVVATHASADHHGGLHEVLQRVPVALLVDGGDGTTDPDFRAILAEADRRNVRRVRGTAGQTLRIGGLVVRILGPRRRPPGPPPEDPNPRAIVAVVSAGDFDLFLSADAESSALADVALPEVEAMKVPHHGSADPGLPDLLRRLRPRIAAIEVGRDNPYGHPTPGTLAALGAVTRHVYRTDRDGTVRLTVEGGEMRVASDR